MSNVLKQTSFIAMIILIWVAQSCKVPTKKAIVDKLTGCPPYQDEVAFPSVRREYKTAVVTTKKEEDEIEPDYLDKMYKDIKEDFEDSGVDLEEITNGFKAKGIIIERKLGTKQLTKEIRVALDGDVAFKPGSAKLTPKARELVSKLGDALNEFKKTLVKIEGHTDSDGSAIGNQRLSERRANSVKVELVNRKGIAAKRIIQVVGYGEERPIASNLTKAGKAKNRRVEIRITPITIKKPVTLNSLIVHSDRRC